MAITLSGLIVGAIILIPHPDLTWHDQQRLGQISFSVLAFGSIFLLRPARTIQVNPLWLWPAIGVLVIGAFSIASALHPLWGLTEYALLIASAGVSTAVFYLIREFREKADLILGGALRLLLASMVLQFYVSFVSALGHPDLYFTPWNLLYGFSNMRFEGQFFTIVVPLLGATLHLPKNGHIRYPRGLDVFLMASLAGMVFVAGTRGTIAAWLVVSVFFWGLKGGARNTASRMFLITVLGCLLAWLMLETVSWTTGQTVDNRFADRQIFGLSAREILWAHAWATIVEFPWLGVGPMHFASLGNRVAAHPHQALLQIASEWGLPVFLLIVIIVVTWLIKVSGRVKSTDTEAGADLRWVLLFSVMSSIVQSMVDGVIVMPYPQLWLAITVGWCSARCLPDYQGSAKEIPRWLPLALWGAANIVLVVMAFMSYPNLVGASEYCGGGPRFWCDGRI